MIDFFSLLTKKQDNPFFGGFDFQTSPVKDEDVNSVMTGNVQNETKKFTNYVEKNVSAFADFKQQEQVKLDAAGNVPLVKNTNVKETSTGLGVEKTSEKQKNADEEVFERNKKSGKPSLEETLKKFYPGYENASPEEQEKMAAKYFSWVEKEKKGVINQLEQFKLYRDRCKSPDEYRRLSKVIDKLEAQYQVSAADTVINEGNELQKDIGAKVVADDYHHYNKFNQTKVAELIVSSKNVDAIKIGASHTSELAVENQTKSVGIYQKSEIADNFKKEVDRILIDQYGKYNKSNQVDIHKIMSNSKFTETVEYAASNIYQFHKDNQVAATQITVATGNEAAINAAASQYAKYDKSVQSQISSALLSSGYQSVANNLANGILNEDSSPKSTFAENIGTSNIATISENSTNPIKNNNKSFSEKIEDIQKILSSNDPNVQEKLAVAIKDFTPAQQIDMLSLLSGDMLVSYIKALMANGSSIQVVDKIKSMVAKGELDQKTTEELIKMLGDNSASVSSFASQTQFSNSAAFVDYLASKGELRLINEDHLTGLAKLKYQSLIKDNKRNEKREVA